MKKYLKYCLFFFLPILIVAIPVEFLLRRVPNPYKFKYEWMQKNAEDVEMLILGSSHTFSAIRPEFLEGKAFSLANVSQGLKIDLFLLEYWADRYKNLKTVICPISYSTLFDRGLEIGGESYRCRYYKIYMDCDLFPGIWLRNLELSDMRTAKGKITKLVFPNADPGYDEYGWGNTNKLSEKKMGKWNDGTEAAAAVKRHTYKNWSYVNQNYALMKEMADFCKKRKIQLVLITTPCWRSYYDHVNEEQLKKMYELIHNIQKEYNLPYFDYLKDPRFEADDFYDSNHLSDIGAIKFTKILDEDIKSIER